MSKSYAKNELLYFLKGKENEITMLKNTISALEAHKQLQEEYINELKIIIEDLVAQNLGLPLEED